MMNHSHQRPRRVGWSRRAMCLLSAAVVSLAPTAIVSAATPPERSHLDTVEVESTGILSGGCNPADLAEPFGFLDFNDVVTYLELFTSGDPAANFAPPDSLDFNDVIGFLEVFAEGEFQQYTSVNFAEIKSVGPYQVEINGSVSVGPDGLANGLVNLFFQGPFGGFIGGVITIANNKMIMDILGVVVLLNNLDFLSLLVDDGFGEILEVPLLPLMDELGVIFQSPQPVVGLTPEVLFVLALSAMGQNEQWAQNIATDRCNASRSPGFWCKAAAIACGAAITAAATAGCIVLTGGCAAGTTVTFGGLAIPCTGLIALCAGGVFAGGAAAYELCLAAWG